MATNIIIPSVGESVTEGVLSRWTVPDNASVKMDDIIAELETDKITLEIRAPASGTIKASIASGTTVKIGQIIGQISEGAAQPAATALQAPAPQSPASQVPASQVPASQVPATQVPAAAASPPASANVSTAALTSSTAHTAAPSVAGVRATPVAEKLAKEHNIDLGAVPPTGPGGRIREQDILEIIEARKGTPLPAPSSPARNGTAPDSEKVKPAAPAPSSPAGSRAKSRERMTPLRQRIASRLVQAQHTAAMLTTFNEVDMTAVMDLRKAYKEEFEKRQGVGLGFMGFFVKAVVAALKAFPLVNASIVEDEAGQMAIERHDYQDIAVAVGTPKGLVVPVLRDCDQRSFASIESGIKELAGRAKDGKLTLDDLQGGTFTITNGGIYGSLMSTPILNPPQSAILGMHAIKNRAVEFPAGSGQVGIRPMMYLALSYDHRIIDGAEAVQFLVRIKQAIEDPQRLLLGL